MGGATKDDIISDLEGKNHILEKRILVLEKELVEAVSDLLTHPPPHPPNQYRVVGIVGL
jgi:hypothetical protein